MEHIMDADERNNANFFSALMTALAVLLALVGVGVAITAATKGLWVTVAVCLVGAILTLALEWFRRAVIEKA